MAHVSRGHEDGPRCVLAGTGEHVQGQRRVTGEGRRRLQEEDPARRAPDVRYQAGHEGCLPVVAARQERTQPREAHGHLRQEDLVEDEGPHHPPEGRPPRRARQDPAERGGDSRAGGGEARRGYCPYGRRRGRKGKRD